MITEDAFAKMVKDMQSSSTHIDLAALFCLGRVSRDFRYTVLNVLDIGGFDASWLEGVQMVQENTAT